MVDMVSSILRHFPDAHVQSGYVRIRCPYHKDGKELKPSMSILLQDKGNMAAGTCHCFACGKVVSIKELFKYIGAEPLSETTIKPAKPRAPVRLTTTPPIYKFQLPYRESDYLLGRGIGTKTQERFRCYERDGKVYMPVFDRSGKLLYVNARSTTGKRFYVEENATKTLWGIEEIDFTRVIAICESQINAMSLWEIGVQAVATLGADNTGVLSQLKRSTSTFLIAFDSDEAGRRGRDKAAALLGKFRCSYLDLPDGIDVNQALQDIVDLNKFKSFLMSKVKKFVL